jgi:hypothetical protein
MKIALPDCRPALLDRMTTTTRGKFPTASPMPEAPPAITELIAHILRCRPQVLRRVKLAAGSSAAVEADSISVRFELSHLPGSTTLLISRPAVINAALSPDIVRSPASEA